VEKSEFDADHRARAGTMVVEPDVDGYYLQKAEGINTKKREKCAGGCTKWNRYSMFLIKG
jgi:hypothetical protein